MTPSSPLQYIENPFPEPVTIRLYLKRDDLIHPQISGNKWRKLKYNLLAAREQGFTTLLTFGGAYSNHLYATGAAGQEFGFQTIGVVRGEELATRPRNAMLAACEHFGMRLHFVSRADYQRKETADFQDKLEVQFGPCYVLPEGGTNALAIRGTSEILPEIIAQLGYVPPYVCCPVGTGGTVTGLAQSASESTEILGFMSLKIPDSDSPSTWTQIRDYHFSGYAKTTPELLEFIRSFERNTSILLDQVYTGKMLYGIYDLARKGYFSAGATVVAVHTGGLQGRSAELDKS
ncbi:1-aminocyclopropane-1-carboxylate deaminase/D-cysteine desulfhydrase [Spirosoma sp. BT702]|uniref:1-aminocyclopropane-1-carboxylate deaminase/D-cysteine desulfhydrase n=1 Tax=Spirosoma profusum TaxID=2771354 RepID=A0A926XWK8_9BACT|nr:1-aminocyclopropane-1-carboxylate deaminase/D-cysteine desulfhydrase [Spirosoma profusum]